MEITLKDLQKLSKRSQLEFPGEKLKEITEQIKEILQFVKLIGKVEDLPPSVLSHPTDQKNVFREDEVTPSLTQEQALANASSSFNGYFKTKAIFKDET